MDPNHPPTWATGLVDWATSTWTGRVVCGLVVLAIVLSRLGRIFKKIIPVVVGCLPIVVTFLSAYWFETPRTFDAAGSSCETANSALSVSEPGNGVIAGPVVPVELRLQSNSTDLSWLEQYWAIQCALSRTFDDHGDTVLIGIMDYATSTQAADRVDPPSSLSPSNLPGKTHASFGPTVRPDGTTVAEVQFASGRLFTDVVVDVPGHDSESAVRARDLAISAARATSDHEREAADVDAHRPFRDYLAGVWAAWLVVLAILPAVILTFADSDRRKLLALHLQVLVLEILGFTGIGSRIGLLSEISAPGRSLVTRIRAIRAARALSSLFSVAAWAVALLLLLRWFPPQTPLWVTSVMVGGIYFSADLVRTAFLGVIPRYRYLRVVSWREWIRRLLSLAVEATYVGLVVYSAGMLAIAWVWTPIDTPKAANPIAPIVYMWLFGPIVFLSVSAIFRAASRRVQARDLETTLRNDPRPQVLYLRSFRDDRHAIPIHLSVYESLGQLFDWSRKSRFEEVLVRRLWRHGPVLAVGRPGEKRAKLGAARLYYPEDAWQEPVRNLVASSALVVVTMGKTPSLGWELRTLRDLGALRKTIVVIPPTRDSLARASVLAELLDLHKPWTGYDGIRHPIAFRFDEDGSCQAVYGDVFDDVAYELALTAAVRPIVA
ncbi:hypothetical protein [Amycolatopsis sp. NPDC051371]|uniref:hypothetical protein n=1 Tax=Amycolatopsis sp. NPDC051371 TaxID=3155800 RepID=UPI00343AD676